MLITVYFTFTSLSTVGFGDYYPVNNQERIFGSFFMLFGVAICSYTMGELNSVLLNTFMGEEEEYET